MSGWLRFDNSTAENPKLVALSDRAFRLWFNACCYCSRNETDGIVPASLVVRLSRTGNRGAVEELVAAGRLEVVDADTYRIHDYLDHNPSRARLEKMRRDAKERTASWRTRNGVGDAVSDRGGDGTCDASQVHHSRARDRSVSVTSSVVDPPTDLQGRSRQPSKRVDQGALPASLPVHLHDTARQSLSVLLGVHLERGGDEPTLRGVGLAVARFPNRDHERVLRELEHWALAGTGQWKPVKDWARTFATFLDRAPAGAPVRVAANGHGSQRDVRRARRLAAMESLIGGDAA